MPPPEIRQKYLSLTVTLALLYFISFISSDAQASSLPENPEKIPWHISALSVTYDNKRNLYIAEDQVIITGGKTRLEADYVEFSNATKDASAQGNVLLIAGNDSVSCDAMKINLITQKGIINKGTIFIQKNNFYIHGENIRKTGEFTYDMDKGSITSCAGDLPDWKISGKQIKVTVEGYGTARDTVFWAKKVPAAYSPFLVFPVKAKRQSGLLLPNVGSSSRKGYYYNQPYFWAISRNTDATFYVDHMSQRGTKLGAEYRYILDNQSKGSMFIDYLSDKKTDDGTDATKDYRYSNTPQRTNSDRYWLRMKHNQKLPNGFTAKADIDVVSDPDYLLEFKNGFTGFSQNIEYFQDEFGRPLDSYDDTTRKNWLNLHKSWSNYSFNVDVLWYDNINTHHLGTDDTTLQTIPGIEFDASKQQIGSSRVYYSLDAEYRSFYRQDTTPTLVNGQRADLYSKLYLPMKLDKKFSFEPSFGIRETLWYTTDFTDIHGNSENLHSRLIPDFNASLSTKLSRIYNPAALDKIKHEITPQLTYTFVPEITQNNLPSFDSLDRISQENKITWSIYNDFISKKSVQKNEGKIEGDYRDLAYLKISQSFDLDKYREDAPRPFSDIIFDAEFNPNKYFSLDADLAWSVYDNEYKKLNAGTLITDNRGDTLRAEYRYTENSLESLFSKIDITISRELSMFFSIERNVKDQIDVEKQAGVTFKRSCWRFNLAYSETPEESSIGFLVTLNGIGEFGKQ